jgi:alanyl-tRNA synthetase
MGQAYPELIRAEALITETLRIEETRFRNTLERGLKLLEEETAAIASGGVLAGETAFRLYDTYGFPLDLTQDALRNRGISVDIGGFESAMAKQRAEARKAWAGSGEAATETVWFEMLDKVGPSEFLGYATDIAEGRIAGLLVDGKPVDIANAGQTIALIANQTPFYGESGGQMGDAGTIIVPGSGKIVVSDAQKKANGLIVHIGVVEEGKVAVGDFAVFAIDKSRRDALRAHHSATHLLHAALHHQIGQHVTQKGSLVAPDRLRFDISHNKGLSPEELRRVEEEVNAEIRANVPVETRVMSSEAAIASGAMALFGEKYGDEVRVVTMGDHDEAYSVELCGGTHVRRTGDIGLFKIVGESAVAAGVRRIEALAGAAAEHWVEEQTDLLTRSAVAAKATPAELPARVMALLEDRKRLERDLADLRRKMASGEGASGGTKVVAGVQFASRQLEDVPAKDLKGMADDLKSQIGSGVVALIGTLDGKASLVVAVTGDLTARVSAVDLVRIGAEALGGKGGGGRPDMAQAGGPDAGRAGDALGAIEAALTKLAAA